MTIEGIAANKNILKFLTNRGLSVYVPYKWIFINIFVLVNCIFLANTVSNSVWKRLPIPELIRPSKSVVEITRIGTWTPVSLHYGLIPSFLTIQDGILKFERF
jgi:hypothetical protein